MPLLQLFRLLLACVLTLANFSVQARLAQNTPLEKMAFSSVDCAQVWRSQALDSYQENGFPDAALVSGPTLYNYFRTYDSKTGGFTQMDPIGLRGGLNRRGAVNGNPLRFTDPWGLDPWWKDPSMKQMSTDNRKVIDWLCRYGGAGSPLPMLSRARNTHGWDRYDDNVAAAERFAEAMEGNFSWYSPWRSDDMVVGKAVLTSLGIGGGSKNASFVGKWGAMGSFYFEQGMSWKDWTKKNCSCGS